MRILRKIERSMVSTMYGVQVKDRTGVKDLMLTSDLSEVTE